MHPQMLDIVIQCLTGGEILCLNEYQTMNKQANSSKW